MEINKDLRTDKILFNKGVRQCDSITPKLLTLAIEDVLKMLYCQHMGKHIDRSNLNHLGFDDDIGIADNDIQ